MTDQSFPIFDGDDLADAPGDFDLEERQALRRVAGLSTELQDVTEVEYRQLRLERVVLVGVWTTGTLTEPGYLHRLRQGEGAARHRRPERRRHGDLRW
jgi:hypothetical protein